MNKMSSSTSDDTSTASTTAVGPLDLSSSLELESWRTIQDILASAAAHHSNDYHNREQQQQQQQQQEEADELTRTVASFEFNIALSFDDDEDDEEIMKMNSLLTALREVSVVFDLIERRTPTLKMMQRMTNNATAQNIEEDDDDTDLFNVSYILTLRSSSSFTSTISSHQDEYDFAMRTRDALGYVLLCHGVDAVAKSGKDWMKFVASEK